MDARTYLESQGMNSTIIDGINDIEAGRNVVRFEIESGLYPRFGGIYPFGPGRLLPVCSTL